MTSSSSGPNLGDTLTWNLSNSENPPSTLWGEGRDVRAAIADQRLKLSYDWCVHIDDSVMATVEARQGDSDASLKVFTVAKGGQGNGILGTVKYDPIGSTLCAYNR